MLKNMIAGALEAPRTVSAGVNSAALDVTGGESLAIVLVISSASSPSGCSAQLTGSNDNSTFIAIGSATNITTNGSLSFTQDRPPYRYYRIQYACTSGTFVSTTTVLVKSDKK